MRVPKQKHQNIHSEATELHKQNEKHLKSKGINNILFASARTLRLKDLYGIAGKITRKKERQKDRRKKREKERATISFENTLLATCDEGMFGQAITYERKRTQNKRLRKDENKK